MLPDGGELLGAGAVGAIVLALIAFIRFFLVRQIRDLRKDVETLRDDLDSLNEKYDEERGLKHKAYNDVARTVMALDLVQRLAEECKCGVLSPLEQVIGRLVTELETMPHRRHVDGPEHPSTTTTTTTTTGGA